MEMKMLLAHMSDEARKDREHEEKMEENKKERKRMRLSNLQGQAVTE